MTKLFPVLIAMIIVSAPYAALEAQVRKIPASVTESFKQKYPGASNVEWKDKLTGFTANFELSGKPCEARFNNKGTWQSTEQKMEKDALPAPVKDGYGKSKYADWPVKYAYKIELPGDTVQYKILAVKSDLQRKNLLFNSDGRLLKDNATL